MYGIGKYGVLPYGSTSIDDGGHGGGGGGQTPPPMSEYSDLMPFLPYYYQKSYEVRALQKVLGQQILLGKIYFENIYEQFYINSATWGLDDIEYEMGIVGNRNKNLKDRRDYILAKIRSRGTTTVAVLKNIGETFFGEDNVEIIEEYSNYTFKIKITNNNAPQQNLRSMLDIIDDVKPAHLVYDIDTTYNIWEDLVDLTWGDVEDYTWIELKLLKNINYAKEV